jgi:hypothetical protein
VALRFSQRIGKTSIKTVLQIDSMDHDLRNSLWNMLMESYLGGLSGINVRQHGYEVLCRYLTVLWADFFKWAIDELPSRGRDIHVELKNWFFQAEWYKVYDLVEFVPCIPLEIMDPSRFRQRCNEILERELSGYRFVGEYISQITNETELKEIEEALRTADEKRLDGVKEHINAALAKLSDRKQPDYRNSIKESISAVESISKIVAQDPKAELGEALKKIKDKIDLHPALERGFKNIYGYTSDEGGIRHALTEESTCDFEDAKYMLVSCSAFINYLIMKSQKAGIL